MRADLLRFLGSDWLAAPSSRPGRQVVFKRCIVEPLEERVLLSSDPFLEDDRFESSCLHTIEPSHRTVAEVRESGESDIASNLPNRLPASAEVVDGVLDSFDELDALNEHELAPVVEEALRLWTDSDLVPDQALLDKTTFEIADLPDRVLGQARGTTVTLDSTAAGWGWFVDTSLGDSVEFAVGLSDTIRMAPESSPAHDRVDLLTVLLHEIGHVIGYGHDYAEGSPTLAVMSDRLSPGERVLFADHPPGTPLEARG